MNQKHKLQNFLIAVLSYIKYVSSFHFLTIWQINIKIQPIAWFCMHVGCSLCVHKSAILSHFPIDKAFRVCNISHLHHRIRELLEESKSVMCILIHKLLCLDSENARVHFLVRIQQSFSLQKYLVKGIVEKIWCLIIHCCFVIVTSNGWTYWFQHAEMCLG